MGNLMKLSTLGETLACLLTNITLMIKKHYAVSQSVNDVLKIHHATMFCALRALAQTEIFSRLELCVLRDKLSSLSDSQFSFFEFFSKRMDCAQ